MRRGREQRADDFTLTRHVEHAAIEVKGTAVIDLVGPRTREAHDTARINVRSATEGVRARTGLQAEHDRAIIHHQREGVVIQRAREGQRARAILGQRRDAAGDTVQGDVARAANAETGGALGQHAGDGRRGRAAIDKRAHAVDARAGDGEAFADGLTVEVERGPRVDGRRARRRTEGVRVVEAEDATVNGGRTRIGIRGGEDDRTGGAGGADDHGIGAAQVSLDRQRRTAAAEAVTGSTGSERSTGGAEDGWRRGPEHQGRVSGEAERRCAVAGQGERAGRAGRQLTGGQPGRSIGIGAGSVQGTGRTNRDGGRGDGRRALNFQEAGTDRGVARVGVRTREDDLTSQEHVGRWTRAAREGTDRHGIRASQHRGDGQRGAATAEEEAAGTRREGARVGAIRGRAEAQRVIAGKVDRGGRIARQSEGTVRGHIDEARGDPTRDVGLRTVGIQGAAFRQLDEARRTRQCALEFGEAVLDVDLGRARVGVRTSERDLTTRKRGGVGADVDATRIAREGVRDGDVIGAREDDATVAIVDAVLQEDVARAERARGRSGEGVDVRDKEVATDDDRTRLDAVGTREGISTEEVELGRARAVGGLHQRAGAGQVAVKADIGTREDVRDTAGIHVTIPIHGGRAGVVLQSTPIIDVDLSRITRPELIGAEVAAVIDRDGFAAEIANTEVVIDFKVTPVDDDIARVRNQVTQTKDHREATRLGQGVAAHVEHGGDVIQGDAETVGAGEGGIADHAEVVDRTISVTAGIEERTELAGASTGNHEELIDGRTRRVQVEGTAIRDGDVATLHAEGGVITELQHALVNIDRDQARGGSDAGRDGIDANLGHNAGTQNGRRVDGPVFKAFEEERARAMDGDVTGTRATGAAHVEAEGTRVDGRTIRNDVRGDLQTDEVLGAQTILDDGEVIACLRPQETVEGVVVAQLGADDEHGVRSGTGFHVLDDGELVRRGGNQAADDLGRAGHVQLTIVDAVTEGNRAGWRELLPAGGRTTVGVVGEGHHHVGDTGANREVAAQSGGKVRVIGRSGQDERARLDGEVRHVGVIALQGHGAVVRQRRTIVERSDG